MSFARQSQIEPLENRRLLTTIPQLIQNANTTPAEQQEYAWLKGELFFAAEDSVGGVELWKSDGTESGTTRVADIRAGELGSFPKSLVTANGRVFFTAFDDQTGRELWSTDGTEEGTTLVRDINGGSQDGLDVTAQLTAAHGMVYFAASSPEFGNELWRTDGTDAGTLRVTDLARGLESANPTNLLVDNDQLFFAASTKAFGNQGIWRVDEAQQVTQLVADTPHSLAKPLAVLEGSLVFVTDDRRWKLWSVDLATFEQSEIFVGVGQSFSNLRASRFQDTVQFTSKAGNKQELWTTDGSAARTTLVKELDSRVISEFTVVGEDYFFIGDGKLYQSDGTLEGTIIISDARNPSHLRVSNSSLYLSIDSDDIGRELVRLEPDGEIVSLDVNPGIASSDAAVISGSAGTTFFWTSHKLGLWALDENLTDFDRVYDKISGSTMGNFPAPLLKVPHGVVFQENDALWTSDGTAIGTRRIATLEGQIEEYVELDKLAYFTTDFGQLYMTDGTAEGTSIIDWPDWPQNLTPYQNQLIYTDANEAGVWILPSPSAEPTKLFDDESKIAATREHLFVFTNDGALWRSDGTAEGSFRVGDMYNGLDVNSRKLIPADNQLFLVFEWSDGFSTVWRSDGTSDGTYQLSPETFDGKVEAVALSDELVFVDETTSGNEGRLWVSDGTNAGTSVIRDGFDASIMAASDRGVIFRGTEGLWLSDGSIDGTKLVEGVAISSTLGTDPRPVVYAGSEQIFFSGLTTEGGFNYAHRELWQSDGTVSGTVQIADINPGLPGSSPKYMTKSTGSLYFTADDGFHGRELYRIPLEAEDLIPGDADGNGDVDFADFLILSQNFGRSDDVVFADGDFDADGKIDFTDFLILSTAFGNGAAPDGKPRVLSH